MNFIQTSKILNTYLFVSHVTDNGEAVEESRATTQAISYIPYGEVFVEQQSGGWSSPYLFNAKELDSETGLYYYGARYLDPSDAMWLSVDPLWEKYVGMSPYNYCGGNPIKYLDPDGKVKKDSDGNVIFEVDNSKKKVRNAETKYIRSGKTYQEYVAEATYQQGYIYTDNGEKVEAMRLCSVVLTDKDGNQTELLGNQELQESLGSDAGGSVSERIINQFKTNCHGFSYADGQVWVDDNQVSTIINNEWHQIEISQQKPDDVITFYDYEGNDNDKGKKTPLWNCPKHSIKSKGYSGGEYKYDNKTRGGAIHYDRSYDEVVGNLKENPYRVYRRNGGAR